jgi:AraC-like DNA-binding protein
MLSIDSFEPCEALRPFIRQYMIVKNGFTVAYHHIVAIPKGFPGFIFTFHETKCLVPPQNSTLHTLHYSFGKTQEGISSIFIGQITQHYQFSLENDCHGLLVVFEPSAMFSFFGLNMSSFTNEFISLDNLQLFPDLNEVEERLDLAKNNPERIHIVETLLLRQLQKKDVKPNPLDVCLSSIFQNKKLITVETLAQELGISRRTLERRFLEQTGVSPKQLLRILRFRQLVQYIMLQPTSKHLKVFQRFNYHDQSHLIKDFHEFTGYAPEQYFNSELYPEKKFMHKLK